MPTDDIGIRALLRAGVARKPSPAELTVRNPDPSVHTSVHTRIRPYILRTAKSEYRPFTVR